MEGVAGPRGLNEIQDGYTDVGIVPRTDVQRDALPPLAARHARLKRLDAWFAGVADAAATARSAGVPLLDLAAALERVAAEAATRGPRGVEKKWGALCTLSVETGAVVYPPIALGHDGDGAGVRSFDEWAHWLHGTRFAREARAAPPKCVEACACSEVLGAEPFVRVTLALLAFLRFFVMTVLFL